MYRCEYIVEDYVTKVAISLRKYVWIYPETILRLGRELKRLLRIRYHLDIFYGNRKIGEQCSGRRFASPIVFEPSSIPAKAAAPVFFLAEEISSGLDIEISDAVENKKRAVPHFWRL